MNDMRSRIKILLVGSRFDHNSGSRVRKLCKYLTYKNYDVTFIVDKLSLKINKVNIIKLGHYPNISGILRWMGIYEVGRLVDKLIYIPDQSILFSLKVFRYLRKNYHNYDVLITSSPPEGIHCIGLWSSYKLGIPWIADFRDMMTQDTSRYKPVTKIHDFLCKRLERRFYREADFVVTVSPPFARMLNSRFSVAENKILVITNGYDPLDFTSVPKEGTRKADEILNLGFNGMFEKGEKLPTEKVLKGIKRANKNGANIQLHLYGYQEPFLKNKIRKWKCDDFVCSYGRISHKESLVSVAKHDALLVCVEDLEYTDVVSPRKLYQYLMMRKPIVGVLPKHGYAAEVIHKSKTGVVFSSKDDLANAFLSFYVKWKNGYVIQPDTNYIAQFSWENLIDKWEMAIRRCISKSERTS
ncbi:MAG: glycosyltransferase [Candidatus Sifarchaeia archaeon]|jgi:glycosyltransferase involved in cell wall biosynthesis